MSTQFLLTLAVAAAWTVPLCAHHSFDAEYDRNKRVTVQGTVTKFDFINPHSWVYIEGKDDTGKMGHWAAEMINPNALLRRGWGKNTLKPGMEITIEGARAKDGTNTVHSTWVKLPDGRTLYTTVSGGADE